MICDAVVKTAHPARKKKRTTHVRDPHPPLRDEVTPPLDGKSRRTTTAMLARVIVVVAHPKLTVKDIILRDIPTIHQVRTGVRVGHRPRTTPLQVITQHHGQATAVVAIPSQKSRLRRGIPPKHHPRKDGTITRTTLLVILTSPLIPRTKNMTARLLVAHTATHTTITKKTSILRIAVLPSTNPRKSQGRKQRFVRRLQAVFTGTHSKGPLVKIAFDKTGSVISMWIKCQRVVVIDEVVARRCVVKSTQKQVVRKNATSLRERKKKSLLKYKNLVDE